ncbi:MAG: hypothetical protein L6R30_26300, partial [Thermoanaerobaculia bacterium]|nr:hypothetical protein [Thermoanaerobaculia bacterium]
MALSGQADLVLHGRDFSPSESVNVLGPVYAYGDWTTPLCNTGNGSCPSHLSAATVNVAGTQASLSVPSGLTPGAYWVVTRHPSGTGSANGKWLLVEPPTKTRPVLSASEHQMATRIVSGQTFEGRFEGNVPQGNLWDYNYYYFTASAGSRITVNLERTDTTLGWENPESLDPRLDIVAPDGFIYATLAGDDVAPGSNLDARISNALLPQTGMYILAASTLRGRGGYRLTFQIDSYGAAVPEERVLSFSGDLQQVTTGSVVNTIATVLDARGLALSGADVDYAAVTGPDDRGTLVFQNGNSRPTNSDGTVTQGVQLTGAGKVRFNITLHEEQLRTATFESPLEPALSFPHPLAGEREGGGAPAGTPAFTPVGHLATRPAIG